MGDQGQRANPLRQDIGDVQSQGGSLLGWSELPFPQLLDGGEDDTDTQFIP